jgi:hypothetical protein
MIRSSYRFDRQEEQALTEFRKTLLGGLNSNDFVSKQVFYESKDGTKVPMFIVHMKDFKQDGTAPAIQYGYVSCAPFLFVSTVPGREEEEEELSLYGLWCYIGRLLHQHLTLLLPLLHELRRTLWRRPRRP